MIYAQGVWKKVAEGTEETEVTDVLNIFTSVPFSS